MNKRLPCCVHTRVAWKKSHLSHVALCPCWTQSFLLPLTPPWLLGIKAGDACMLCYQGLHSKAFYYLMIHSFILETGSLCAALANLKLAMWPRLTPNSLHS